MSIKVKERNGKLCGTALPADEARFAKGGDMFFRGDDRPPDEIFNDGFKKRNENVKQPRIKQNKTKDGKAMCPDIESETAVCLSRSFGAAALYPFTRKKSVSFIYVVDLNSNDMFNTQGFQFDYLLKKLGDDITAQNAIDRAFNLGDREWAVNAVHYSRIIGCFAIVRKFDHKNDNRRGGVLYIKKFMLNKKNYKPRKEEHMSKILKWVDKALKDHKKHGGIAIPEKKDGIVIADVKKDIRKSKSSK